MAVMARTEPGQKLHPDLPWVRQRPREGPTTSAAAKLTESRPSKEGAGVDLTHCATTIPPPPPDSKSWSHPKCCGKGKHSRSSDSRLFWPGWLGWAILVFTFALPAQCFGHWLSCTVNYRWETLSNEQPGKEDDVCSAVHWKVRFEIFLCANTSLDDEFPWEIPNESQVCAKGYLRKGRCLNRYMWKITLGSHHLRS